MKKLISCSFCCRCTCVWDGRMLRSNRRHPPRHPRHLPRHPRHPPQRLRHLPQRRHRLLQRPAASKLIKVGIVNNPPAESGYRAANVADFEKVFTEANGYAVSTFYSLKNDEQLNAAAQFITDGVDYLLISAAATDGWDTVLTNAKEAGIKVFLFDRMLKADESLYEAAVVSNMANEGTTAVNWLKSQKLASYNVIHIQGAMGSDAQIGRTAALDAEFKAGTMKKVVQQTATWDEADGKENCRIGNQFQRQIQRYLCRK